MTTGNISALAGLGDDARSLQFTAPIQPGNSGGPLVDVTGNVVGIVTSKLSPLWAAKNIGDVPQNVNFALKASVIREFLESRGVKYQAKNLGAAVPVTDLPGKVSGAVFPLQCLGTMETESPAEIAINALKHTRAVGASRVSYQDFAAAVSGARVSVDGYLNMPKDVRGNAVTVRAEVEQAIQYLELARQAWEDHILDHHDRNVAIGRELTALSSKMVCAPLEFVFDDSKHGSPTGGNLSEVEVFKLVTWSVSRDPGPLWDCAAERIQEAEILNYSGFPAK
jgi:hypothetical protein